MKRKTLKISMILLIAFILWTAAVSFIDVLPVGPENTEVGFSHINLFVFNLTGVHYGLYAITDLLSLVPLIICLLFAACGLSQWIRRKSLRKVDFSLLALGGYYLIIIFIYFLFERVVINVRPVLIDGNLEPSYPSSTTVLNLCVMTTARTVLCARMKSIRLKRLITYVFSVFSAFMVVGRLLSGVHRFTDIAGGVLLSAALVTMYHAAIKGDSRYEQRKSSENLER